MVSPWRTYPDMPQAVAQLGDLFGLDEPQPATDGQRGRSARDREGNSWTLATRELSR